MRHFIHKVQITIKDITKESLFIKTLIVSFKNKTGLGFQRITVSYTGNSTVVINIIAKCSSRRVFVRTV